MGTKFSWASVLSVLAIALNFFALGFFIKDYLKTPSYQTEQTAEKPQVRAVSELPTLNEAQAAFTPVVAELSKVRKLSKKNALYDLTREAKRRYEERLDDYINQTFFGSPSDQAKRLAKIFAHDKPGSKNSQMEEYKSSLLAQLPHATGKEKERILNELRKMDMDSFEGPPTITKVTNDELADPRGKRMSWGPCDEVKGIEKDAIITDVPKEGRNMDPLSNAPAKGFIVKVFTEDGKTFIAQDFIPVRPDDPKGCGAGYKYKFYDLLTPRMKEGKDAALITLATLSTTDEIKSENLNFIFPKKPQNVKIETEEMSTQ
jgi:hypothetical protein